MSKVYCVFYTDNGRVIWGIGGKSGNPPTQRAGYHLPGGTIHRERRREFGVPQILATLIKELNEEFGPTLGNTILNALCDNGKGRCTKQMLNGHLVYFCFFKIKSLLFPPGLRIPIRDGDNTNRYDEAFTHLIFDHYKEDPNMPSWFRIAIDQWINGVQGYISVQLKILRGFG